MSLTPEQLKLRRSKVTASTLPAFLGYSKWDSPFHAWMAHVHGALRSNNLTQMGEDLEAGIARFAARDIGVDPDTLEPGTTLAHPEHPFLAATPDFLIPDLPMRGMQIKNHSPHMTRAYQGPPGQRGEWDNGLVPIEYELQCQIEMLVVGGVYGPPPLFWYLAAYFGGAHVRTYRIRRNERLQAALLERGREFWAECIDPEGPQREPDPVRWPWRAGRIEHREHARRAKRLGPEELLSAPLPELPMGEIALPKPDFDEVS